MAKKNLKVGNGLLVVSTLYPSPSRAQCCEISSVLSLLFMFELPFQCLPVCHVCNGPSASPLLSSSSLIHTGTFPTWGRKPPLERLWPRPRELTCLLRYTANTWAAPATLGLTPNLAASEPAKGLQLPLPLWDPRASTEGSASGG